MILRICIDGTERLEPASPAKVEAVFAPDAAIADGTEITLADGERWVAAMAVGAPGSPAELLLSGADGQTATLSGTAPRPEALRRFREFLAGSGSVR